MIKPRDKLSFWTYPLLLLVLGVNIFYIIARTNIPVDGISSKDVNGQCVIISLRPGSPAEIAGIRPGDVLEKVGNKPVNGIPLKVLLEQYRAGETVSYLITRDSRDVPVALTLQSLWSLNPWFYFFLYSLIFIVSTTSLYILYRKPYDQTARIFFIYLQLLAVTQNFRFLYLDDNYALFATFIYIISFNLFGVVLLHFHLVFPKPVPSYLRNKHVLKLLYAAGAIFGLFFSAVYFYRMNSGSAGAISIFNIVQRFSYIWMGLTLFLALTIATYQFKASKNTRSYKQLRLVMAGSIFGLATPIFFSIYPEFFRNLEQEHNLLIVSEFTNWIGNYIMTTFLAFAIFQYRLWNIEPIVKKAILYGVATIFIYSVYILLVSLGNNMLLEESKATHFIVFAVSMALFLLLRDKIQRPIDRLFYRESYNSAHVASEFEENLAGVYQMDELKSKIILYLNNIFHFKSFIFMLKTAEFTYRPVFMDGIEPSLVEGKFSMDGEMEDLLFKSKVFSTEELSVKPGIIEILNGELVVPISITKRPCGLLIVGAKRSEKSYTLQDIQLLSLLARRIVALLHTADLYQQELDRNLMLERERTRIANDFHDDVGASLTRISILTQMIWKNDSNPLLTRQWLQLISDTCREASQGITSIIWALNTKNDTFQGMVAFIRRFALEFLEETPVLCTFNVQEDLPEFDIKAEIRRDIYLCVREALNNVVRHSKAAEVCISFKMIKDGFLLSIKDDGAGFDPDNMADQGHGLINMKNRIDGIKGEFHIEAAPGLGTELSYSIPVSPKA